MNLSGRVILGKSELPAEAEHPVGAAPPPRWFVRVLGGVLAILGLLVLGPFLAVYAGLCWRLFWVGAAS